MVTNPPTHPEKLLPCPCCQNEAAKQVQGLASLLWHIKCPENLNGCGLQTKKFVSRSQAVAAWNRRAPSALDTANERIAALEALINTPVTDDWFDGVKLEAAHQQERWPSDHDPGKTQWDWFWLIGYLAQKAATSASSGDAEKAKHHTISTGAALLNWHRQLSGLVNGMRPGIERPKDVP